MRRQRGFILLAIATVIAAAGILPQMFPSDEHLLAQATQLLQAQGQGPEAAIPVLDKLLSHNPTHPKALLYRAQIARDQGDTDLALQTLQRLQTGPPEDVSLGRFILGNLFLDRSDARAAEAAFRQSTDLAVSSLAASERLIPLFGLQRRPEEVRAQLSHIRQHRNLTLPEMALWITSDDRLTEFDSAILQLRSFVQQHPEDVHSLTALCRYLSEEGQVTEAIQALQADLVASPSHSRSAALLASLLIKSTDIAAASELLERFPLSSQSELDDWRTAGDLAIARDDWGRARVAYSYVAPMAPFDRTAAYKYSQCLEKCGAAPEAAHWRQLAEALNELHADVESVGIMIVRRQLRPELLLKVSQLLMQIDRPIEAREWAREVALLSPQSAPAKEILARTISGTKELQTPVPPLDSWGDLPTSQKLASMTESASHVSFSQIHLENVAESSGLQFQYENGHTGFKYLIETMGGAVGVLDYDRDQWPDLYCPQGGPLGQGPMIPPTSDQLFRNLGGGRFANRTQSAGLAEFGYSQGCAAGDIDNDGFDDLVVANVGRNTLFWNCGDGTFEDFTEIAGFSDTTGMSSSVALADLDGDSDLDIYVVNYVDMLKICRDDKGRISTCNPSSHHAAEDQLFENLGAGTFRDVSVSAQITAPRGKGLGVVIAHLDPDSRPDIFVTNDTTPNFLYVNESQTGVLRFHETGLLAGVAVNGDGLAQAGMGIACADLDQNGQLDLHVTNFYREANSLFLQSDGMFTDSTTRAGLREPTLPLLGFGTQAIDLDLNGWDEIFVTNGHIDDQTEAGVPWKMPPQIFRTTNGTNWQEILDSQGDYLHQKSLGRGVARWDPDRNGQPDLVIGHQDRPVAYLKNLTPHSGHFLSLRLVGSHSNRDAINSIIRWKVAGHERMTEICGGDGYYSSNDRVVTIGLGPAETVDWLEVEWLSGQKDRFQNINSDRHFVLLEGGQLLDDSDPAQVNFPQTP